MKKSPHTGESTRVTFRTLLFARVGQTFSSAYSNHRRFLAPYLNNIVEQDHRFIKKRIAASLGFRSVTGAVNTIGGYEVMHMIRKGQVQWLAKGDVVGQVRFINQTLGLAA